MTRIILAATLAAATLVGWFLLSIARLARQLERDASPLPGDVPSTDDIVGMPYVIHLTFAQPQTVDWDAFFDTAGRMN